MIGVSSQLLSPTSRVWPRGLLTEARLSRIHDRISAELAESGARLDAFYYCPHHPEAEDPRFRATCECRKPEPGMLLRAAREMGIRLDRSYLIGDSARDVEAGHRAGCISVRVRCRSGSQEEARGEAGELFSPPDHIGRDILDAVNWILENERARETRSHSGRAE